MGVETESKQNVKVIPTVPGAQNVSYTAVATVVPSVVEIGKAYNTVSSEYSSIPETQDLVWSDDFFEDDDSVVAVFDFDYETMENFYTNVGWCWIGATLLYSPLFTMALLGLVPCYLRKNVHWHANAQHVAITRDGIRFVKDRRRTCWGNSCTDAGKTSKTVPFDKITDCDIVEPAGNSCLCIENVLYTINVDTASSGQGRHELQIAGLKDPHGFKKLVWAMKRAKGGEQAPVAMEMASRASDGAGSEVSELLREIRDELRQNNALLQNAQPSAIAAPVPSGPDTETDGELV